MFGLPWMRVDGKQSQLPLGGGPLAVYDLVGKTMTFQDDVEIRAKSGKSLTVNIGGGNAGAVTQITSTVTGVTLSKLSGVITTFASTLAAAGEEVFTVTNTLVELGDVVVACVGVYAGTGTPMVAVSKVSAGSFDITVANLHASAAFNGSMTINFAVLKSSA